MYLTEINIDFQTAALRDFRDAYAWHQRAWECFDLPKGTDRPFLTRLDRRDSGWRMLLLSQLPANRPEWCPDYEENWRMREVSETFLSKDRYRFSLRANATKKPCKTPDGKLIEKRRRVAIYNHEELAGWLTRKGQEHGFQVEPDTSRILRHGKQHFVRKDAKEENRYKLGTLNAVDFEGILRVTDRDAFITAFQQGIGPAKAFGFGMLVLAPINQS